MIQFRVQVHSVNKHFTFSILTVALFLFTITRLVSNLSILQVAHGVKAFKPPLSNFMLKHFIDVLKMLFFPVYFAS